ncbi:MAG: sugar ABC transporter substrate-binding protein [Anaerolineales bacterium]|nr:sugar ABC transporter substrate-binding protein [Anaerolineales bacterium]
MAKRSYLPLPLLATLAFVLLVAACKKVETPSVSFLVFGDPEEVAAYQALVDEFKTQYPEIGLELQHVPSQGDFNTRLAADFSAGNPPDVMLLNYRRFAFFASQGGLQALGPYLAESSLLDEANFFPPTIEAFIYQDQLWCIPQNISSLVVYYNQRLFDLASLPYPQPGWTLDDFLAAAQALTLDLDGDGKTDQYGAGIDPSLMRLAPFIWMVGGELVDDPQQPTRLALDSPAALSAFQWFVDLQVQYHVLPDAVADSAQSGEDRFLNGTLAMYFNSRRGVPTYRTITAFTWNIAPLPSGGQPAGILHSDAYCMAAASTQKESAWKFIEFANSSQGQTIIAQTGRTVPSLEAVAASPAFLDPLKPPASSQVFMDVIPALRRLPLVANWPSIEETTNREIERAFYGQISVPEAAAAAVAATLEFFEPGP